MQKISDTKPHIKQNKPFTDDEHVCVCLYQGVLMMSVCVCVYQRVLSVCVYQRVLMMSVCV